ncbi:Lipid A export ATP-binding/permease protein MsbA [Streptococcus sp. DD13]|nr:Lipid A export ATP-binding/permease protein MsbA [Streptococcus sp. DD13]
MKTKANAVFFLEQGIKQSLDHYHALLSYEDFHQKDHGERLSTYVHDVNKVLDLTLEKWLSMVEKAATTLFVFLGLALIHYSMAILALVSFGVMTIVPQLFQKKLSGLILQTQEAKEGYLAKMRELLQGYDTFLENVAFSVFFQKSREASYRYSKVVLKTETFTAMMSAVLTFVNALVTVFALGFLSYLVLIGRVEMGAFLSVSALLPSFGAAVMVFISEREFYRSGQDLYASQFADVNLFSESSNEWTSALWSKQAGLIESAQMKDSPTQVIEDLALHNIHVSYGEKAINLPSNLIFEKGKKYALTGESGCGKTSLLRILTGQILPQSGDYLVNQQVNQGPVFHSLSYVNQQTFLFNDSIRRNVDLKGEHTDEDIKRILSLLKLDAFEPDTLIEDNGSNLSGGQRQRIAIARAMLRGKSVMILDEATASLDQETAQQVEKSILSQVPTVIMVSHHLSDATKSFLNQVIELGA